MVLQRSSYLRSEHYNLSHATYPFPPDRFLRKAVENIKVVRGMITIVYGSILPPFYLYGKITCE
jgi:hypothetical protein